MAIDLLAGNLCVLWYMSSHITAPSHSTLALSREILAPSRPSTYSILRRLPALVYEQVGIKLALLAAVASDAYIAL